MTSRLSWAPQRAVFLRRAAVTALFTFLALMAVGLLLSFYTDLPFLWVIPTALLLTAGFLFDDALRWRASKYDRWHLEGGHLIHEDGDGTAQLPLSEIDRVFTRFGGRVVVELSSGQRIAIGYLPYPAKTAETIEAARRGPLAD